MSSSDQGQSGLDQALVEAKLTRWATWPVGAGHSSAHVAKFVAVTAAIAAAIVGVTWLFAAGSEESRPLCNGREMSPGEQCIFYNPERTLNYDQMMQRAADSASHPFAWTITIAVLILAALIIAGQVVRHLRSRTPTQDELHDFMVHVNDARTELEAKLAADRNDHEARRQLEVFGRAVDRFARENGFRVDGSRASLDE